MRKSQLFELYHRKMTSDQGDYGLHSCPKDHLVIDSKPNTLLVTSEFERNPSTYTFFEEQVGFFGYPSFVNLHHIEYPEYITEHGDRADKSVFEIFRINVAALEKTWRNRTGSVEVDSTVRIIWIEDTTAEEFVKEKMLDSRLSHLWFGLRSALPV